MNRIESEKLMAQAKHAREKAYAPYSNFFVGAALLCEDGTVVEGCNIENAAYSPTCCAERVALFSAVSRGHRHFSAIALAGGREAIPTAMVTPCGVCRQVLAEFCAPSLSVLLVGEDGEILETTLGDLLPQGFSLS